MKKSSDLFRPCWWKPRSADELNATSKTALSFLNKTSSTLQTTRRVLHTGVSIVDEIFKGGFKPGILIEIAGEPGAGKTQLCLTCVANIVFDDFKYSNQSENEKQRVALYINTENRFPIERLVSFFEHRLADDTKKKQKLNCLMDQVYIQNIKNESLDVLLEKGLPLLFKSYIVSIIVLDSIADLYRLLPFDYDFYKAISLRAARLTRLAAVLKRLAGQHNSFLLITNQVTAQVASLSKAQLGTNTELSSCINMDLAANQPSLGLAWSSNVNCRIQLCRCIGTHRTLHIIFDSFRPHQKAQFRIDDSGIVSDDDTEE